MRRRLFGEPYWMGLTKARSPPYVYDLVLERRIKTLVKQEADRAKDGRPADFNADFPTIAKRFKNDRVLKVRGQPPDAYAAISTGHVQEAHPGGNKLAYFCLEPCLSRVALVVIGAAAC